MKKTIVLIISLLMISASATACSGTQSDTKSAKTTGETTAVATSDQNTTAQTSNSNTSGSDASQVSATANTTSGGALDASDFFSERDLLQTADLTGATEYTLSDNSNITITAPGVYVISGTAKNASIIVEAGDDDKVQLVLSGASITNTSAPAVYVKNADKVFITTADGSSNSMTVSGSFSADGTTNTDAVIFSKDDLVFNGLGTLTVNSSDNGISGKDDIKITGGTLNITSTSDAIEANDSIVVSDGKVTIKSGKDGLHAENDEDNTTGYIYICGGSFDINAQSDGIQATTVTQIDGGSITITASEGVEGTYVQFNGGTVSITATDDGVNASQKSNSYRPTIEVAGGNLTVDMGQGDTDALDSNGALYITGGTLNITAQSPFDYDGEGSLSGATVYVNGELTTELTNQMMGGMGGPGGMGGGMNGGMGGADGMGGNPQ